MQFTSVQTIRRQSKTEKKYELTAFTLFPLL